MQDILLLYPTLHEASEDKFVDNDGYKINVDKIKDVLLVEEIRQLYNMYCGVR